MYQYKYPDPESLNAFKIKKNKLMNVKARELKGF